MKDGFSNPLTSNDERRFLRSQREALWAVYVNLRARACAAVCPVEKVRLQNEESVAAVNVKVTAEETIRELHEKIERLERKNFNLHIELTTLKQTASAAGWQFDEESNQLMPPQCTGCLPHIDLREINPFASIESPQALADERRERLEAGYSARVVDAARRK